MHLTFAEEYIAIIIAANQGGQYVDALAAPDVVEVAARFAGFHAAERELVIASIWKQAMRDSEVVGGEAVHLESLAHRCPINASSEQCGLMFDRRLPHSFEVGAQGTELLQAENRNAVHGGIARLVDGGLKQGRFEIEPRFKALV